MAGRFPHDASRQHQQRQPPQPPPPPQLNPAVRAALGLGPATMDEAKAAFFLQQQQQHQQQQQQHQQQQQQQHQQRQQEMQREQLRQMFLQEQLEHQSKLDSILHQQQLRMIGEHLQEFPDFQQNYQSLLLKQFQRQEERAFLQEHAQLCYQEELRRQQQQQHQQHQQQTQAQQQQGSANTAAASAAAALGNSSMIRDMVHATAAADAGGGSVGGSNKAIKDVASAGASVSGGQPRKRRISDDSASAAAAAVAASSKRSSRLQQQQQPGDVENDNRDRKPKGRPRGANKMPGRGAKRLSMTHLNHRTPPSATSSEDKKISGSASSKHHPYNQQQPQQPEFKMQWMDGEWTLVPARTESTSSPEDFDVSADNETMEQSAIELNHVDYGAETSIVHEMKTLGTVEHLIAAAAMEDKADEVVDTIAKLKNTVTWPDSETDDGNDANREARLANKKGYVFSVAGFQSFIPQLPVEPELQVPTPAASAAQIEADVVEVVAAAAAKPVTGKVGNDANGTKGKKASRPGDKHHLATTAAAGASEAHVGNKDVAGDSTTAAKTDADYPYPVDTWWPSVTSIRRERRSNGEESDEDAFSDDPRFAHKENEASTTNAFRINHNIIRRRLATKLEPGVLEKLPHCKVHRMAMKWRHQFSPIELVHCFQVTELYPNDVMVCCSICGTWRHAKCGGHYKDFSIRECIEAPFQAICDRCHVEEQVLADFPRAQKRIERQRLEQIRRGLMTSAVMRQASFSKHGGTYKWPLGSVTLSHFGGHTRSVHSRHDKAEKQWTDMATRLSKSHYSRQKDRIKVRTKELERLLVSVEDAEDYTDRHNAYVFLLRDTARERPVGYEQGRRNLFDPEEDIITHAVVDPSIENKIPRQDIVILDQLATSVEGVGDMVEHATEEAAIEFQLQAAIQQVKQEQELQHQIGVELQAEEEEELESDGVRSVELQPAKCSRVGCFKAPRFDSIFCSDSCGVSALESDLLRALNYASDIHPSLFRG